MLDSGPERELGRIMPSEKDLFGRHNVEEVRKNKEGKGVSKQDLAKNVREKKKSQRGRN